MTIWLMVIYSEFSHSKWWFMRIDLMELIDFIITGRWLNYPSQKYEFVNWDDDIPNSDGKIANVPNHQPD